MTELTDEERAARVAEKLIHGDDRSTIDAAAYRLEVELMQAKWEAEMARERARLQIASTGR